MLNPYSHFIHTGELFFKKNYFKLTRSQSLKQQKLQILPTCVLFLPDDANNTYVEIDKDFQLNKNICNVPTAKAHIWFDIGDILRSSFIS